MLGVVDDGLVRTAAGSDVPALVELRAEMFEAMGVVEHDPLWRDHAHRWFTERVDDPSYCFVVVEHAGTVVACAFGVVRDAAPSPGVPCGGDVLISNVCARPWARGRGFGTAAFEAVMDWAHASGIGRAELLTTAAGEAMYGRAGFSRIDYPLMRAGLGSCGR